VGDELARVMANQRSLEARYDALVEERAHLKGHAHRVRLAEVVAEIGSVGEELRESVKTLMRSLKEQPDPADALGRIAEERARVERLLAAAAAELRSEGRFTGLTDFVRTDFEARERLAAVAAREEEITREVAQLSATLADEEERHSRESDLKRAEINVLKEKMRKMKLDTGLTLRYARKEINAGNEAVGRLNLVGEAALQAEVAELQRRLAVEAAASEAAAEVLKKEQEEAAKLAEEWKARHARELAEKQAALKALVEARDAQRAELARLQDRYEEDLQAMVETKAAADAETQRILEAGEEATRRKVAATQLQKIVALEMFLTVQGYLSNLEDSKKKKK